MALLSQSPVIYSGLISKSSRAKLPFQNRDWKFDTVKFDNYSSVKLLKSQRIPMGHFRESSGSRFVVSMAREPYQSSSFDDNWIHEPFFLNFVKEALWGIKSVLNFLVEQPSQLKYIEWPGFASTLKTATLTLVLVAVLIVALSSIDSSLSYLLALLLRKTP
ncbi:Protein translocase complex [Parasponia andersonii]|uniref:Protein translocase complex n=1 Tax=Parasponia andersonii TaxID=3476 RepID=A0A2P5B8C6_PARAD|nr:Protein translocase complex [Parasponia andersonii]